MYDLFHLDQTGNVVYQSHHNTRAVSAVEYKRDALNLTAKQLNAKVVEVCVYRNITKIASTTTNQETTMTTTLRRHEGFGPTYAWQVELKQDNQSSFLYFHTSTAALRAYPSATLEVRDDQDPSTVQRERLSDLVTSTIPEILLNVERAHLRGETLPADWYVRRLTELESEILAVL